MKLRTIAAAAAFLLALGMGSHAEARSHLSIGIGLPLYASYAWGGWGWHGPRAGMSVGISPWGVGIGVSPWHHVRPAMSLFHHGWYAAPAVVFPAVIPSATIRFTSGAPAVRCSAPGWYPVGHSPASPIAPAGLSPAGAAPAGAPAPGMAPGELPIRPVKLPVSAGGEFPAAVQAASPAGAVIPAGAASSGL